MKAFFGKNIAFVLLCAGGLCLLTACSPVLKVAVAPDGSLAYSFESSVSPVIAQTVRSFTGAEASLPLFNAAQIQEALEEAGLPATETTTPDSSSLAVAALIEAESLPVPKAPSLGSGEACIDMVPQIPGAIGYCHSPKPGSRKLLLTLSPEILQQVMGIVPQETAEYLELLSAPIFSGEQMTADEYLDLIRVVYGPTVAKELEKAQVRVLVTAPDTIQTATISSRTGMVRKKDNYAEFSLALSDLLVNLGRIEFLVQY